MIEFSDSAVYETNGTRTAFLRMKSQYLGLPSHHVKDKCSTFDGAYAVQEERTKIITMASIPIDP